MQTPGGMHNGLTPLPLSQKANHLLMSSINKAQIKLPRTGIEQPFMKEIPRFIDTHREFERIAVVNVSEK